MRQIKRENRRQKEGNKVEHGVISAMFGHNEGWLRPLKALSDITTILNCIQKKINLCIKK